MEKVQIIILAAGKGKRMNSEDIPKVLIEINNEPIIKYALKSIKESKICKKPIIVIGFQGQKVVQALGTNYNYIEQKEQLGTGHAVGVCKDHLENKAENILVLYGDHPTITPKMLKDLVKSHIESKSVITLTTIKIPDFNDWRSAFYSSGRIIRNNKGEVSAIVEKKDASPEQLNITELNASYLCFNAKWLWENITKLKNNNSQKEYYLTDFLKLASNQKEKINTILIDTHEALGINTPEQLEIVTKFISQHSNL